MAIIWREETDYARDVIDWLREFEHRTGRQPESFSPDSPEGESLCRAYDVMEYPAILAFGDDGKLLQEWHGMNPSLPRIDDVNYYMLNQ
ncbi:MAG: hypothetical protein MJ154_00120 [Candidatus Saccharibacteria bacterium]|nr:hypothetical protein [Candidatus Saccharibacteria bacterium]